MVINDERAKFFEKMDELLKSRNQWRSKAMMRSHRIDELEAELRRLKGQGYDQMAVNEAGNYTKPTMRKNLFNRIKASNKGGRPGQWSARKAQMLAKQYKANGGGYRD